MKRLLAALSLVVVVAAGALGLYRVVHGPSGGLKALDEENVGFELRCGETARWEAALIGNTSRASAVIKRVELVHPPRGFRLAYARTVMGDGQAGNPLVGARIGHSPTPTTAGHAWHVVIGIETPSC